MKSRRLALAAAIVAAGFFSTAFVQVVFLSASAGGGGVTETNPGAANLVAWYDMEDAADSHSGGYDLTTSGGAFASGGRPGDAVTFTTNQWMYRADGAEFEPGSGNFSVSLWAQLTDATPTINGFVIGKWTSTGNQRGWELFWQTTGEINFNVTSDGTGATNATAAGSFVTSDATWTHLVAVYEAGTSIKTYINGSLDGINTTSIPSSVYNSTSPLRINSDGTTEQAGRYDSIGYFNDALTAAEITWLYNSGAGRDYWDLYRNTDTFTHYVALDGSADYVSTPASAGNTVTGSIDIRVKVAADDWDEATTGDCIISQWSGSDGAWALSRYNGTTNFYLSSTGSWTGGMSSSTSLGVADGEAIWLRVAANPATPTATFYKSSDYDPTTEAGTWTALTTTGNDFSGSSINDSSDPIVIGGATISEPFAGKVYYAEVRDGIDGTIVARFNASETEAGATFANVSGETYWTNSGGVYVNTDTPPQTSLAAWYMADAGVYNTGTTDATDGQTVATWADQSGNGNDLTQATEASKPLFQTAEQNGLPGVQFQGTDDFLSGAIPTDESFSVYIVASTSDATIGNLFSYDDASSESYNYTISTDGATTGKLYYRGRDSGVWDFQLYSAAAYSTVSPFIASLVNNDTPDSHAVWLNGVAGGTSTAAVGVWGNFDVMTVGASGDSTPGGYLVGFIYEILVYDVAHDADQRAQVEGYLAAKWGL